MQKVLGKTGSAEQSDISKEGIEKRFVVDHDMKGHSIEGKESFQSSNKNNIELEQSEREKLKKYPHLNSEDSSYQAIIHNHIHYLGGLPQLDRSLVNPYAPKEV